MALGVKYLKANSEYPVAPSELEFNSIKIEGTDIDLLPILSYEVIRDLTEMVEKFQ